MLHLGKDIVEGAEGLVFGNRRFQRAGVELVLQRFRELVAAAGCVSGPPVFGPAAGALLEAYRAAGLQPALSNVPEFKT